MSTYIGFISQKNSAKISKPPGGVSSDIFATVEDTATPRSINNHMKSNIFGSPPQNKTTDVRRPNQANSHARLFGDVEKSFPGTKQNYMKSSIPIGGPINSMMNENMDSNDRILKVEASEKKDITPTVDKSSSSIQNKNKNRVPPGGFASILW